MGEATDGRSHGLEKRYDHRTHTHGRRDAMRGLKSGWMEGERSFCLSVAGHLDFFLDGVRYWDSYVGRLEHNCYWKSG